MASQSGAPGWTLPWLMATKRRIRSFSGVHEKGILTEEGDENMKTVLICVIVCKGIEVVSDEQSD